MASDISGPGGNFAGPSGFSMHIAGWSASYSVTTVETTGFADVGNRTYEPTAVVMTGAADGTIQTVNTPIAASGVGATPTMSAIKGTFTLTAASGDLHSFAGVVTSVSISRRHDGKADGGITFVSSGPITQTWG